MGERVVGLAGGLVVMAGVAAVCCGGVARDLAPEVPKASVVALEIAAPEVVRGAAIDDAAFLAGDWSAQREGDYTQEVWSQPSGNNMMGMFRWVTEDGTAAVFEMLTITEEDDTLVLRLRHQDARGNAWEAQDKPATLHLTGVRGAADDSGAMVEFTDTTGSCDLAACVYECATDQTLRITVKFDDAGQEELVFELRRAE